MNLNKYIDHTLLKPQATKKDIIKLCEEAKKYHFMTCMVNPYWLKVVKDNLQGSDVLTACVIGFPLGAMTCASKVFEASNAIEQGADEIDMVLNIGALKDGDDQYVINEIKAVKKVCANHCLKVIIETCLLTKEEKIRATQDIISAGADFVKTSTGFSLSGATVEDVQILKQVAGNKIKVKAAGGVRCQDDLQKMIEAGADRIGTSSGVKLMTELDKA